MTETSTDAVTGWTRRGFVGTAAAVGTAATIGIGAAPAAQAAGAVAGAAEDRIPAFPGAEGAGKWAKGGRGGSVYEVTTLNDSGPGSLRDAVSGSDRTVVFRVSGTIQLQSQLLIAGNNLTIAGQTAPCGGICLSGHSTGIKGGAHDIVIRYLRFRLGDLNAIADDAFNTNVPGSVSPEIRNLIIDHCSFSWAVDECLSPYGNFDVTVQWCIVAEGLALSAHPKSRHGYGGIWGGERNSYHHNLIAHQGGRQPRFGYTEGINLEVDHRNNVVYDHGYTSVYGGEWANGINIVGNYYKPGPSTLADVAPVILSANRGGQWYVDGNHVDGHPDVTAHNRRGVRYPIGGIAELAEPVRFADEIDAQTPAKAYEAVLASAGAILPRRDAADARIVNDVRNGTGRLINSQKEVGGFPPLVSAEPPVDSDHDGIPDWWEKANGLDPADPSDAQKIAPNGYTYLENYLNSIVPDPVGNPTVRLTSPTHNQVVAKRTAPTVTLEADATAARGGQLAKVEFFAGDQLIGTATSVPYRATWTNVADGTYWLTARATDHNGTATQSAAVPVHVNLQAGTPGWTSAAVGKPPVQGSGSLDGGILTIKGSGRILGRTGNFHYVYRKLRVGGAGSVAQVTARLDSLAKVANGLTAGLMIRDSLDPAAPFMYGGIGFGVAGGLGTVNDDGGSSSVTDDGGMKAQAIRIQPSGPAPSVGPWPWTEDEYLDPAKQYWLRLLRRERPQAGEVEFEAFISEDKTKWDRFGYERLVMPSLTFYIGFAVDGGRENNGLVDYGTAQFSAITVEQ
ncbi:pectate lyase [Kribbella orskensis]|uniref:Pectate lyase n=1 Tax=Kribbella orskensis TaxID=2512216 RepID=A0ABY2BH34_9ACTN|nr:MULTISPECIES: Ig-like domain-containing protein [Kribbella]TCN38329.1 pectate lyase [Kribbella sp. VKM Ac-2500]TCO20141.1 pectate lyase [Kribbella orskensis]